MIVCLQDPMLPLESTCVTVPTEETFQSVPECINFIKGFQQRNYDPKMYVTGFCTSKGSI